MRSVKSLCLLFLLLTSFASAQEESLGYLLRRDGAALEAATLEKLVDLELSPQWLKAIYHPTDPSARAALREVLAAWMSAGTALTAEDPRKMRTGLSLATLESWRPRLRLKLVLKSSPDNRKATLRGLRRLATAMEAALKPEGDRFRARIEFRQGLERTQVGALVEQGSQMNLLLPADRDWDSSHLEDVFRRFSRALSHS